MFKILITTGIALTGFAANSVLCRLALSSRAIDAASFTSVRLAAGALTLAVILAARQSAGRKAVTGRWSSAVLLFAYAAAFSFAYLALEAGTGALILFGSVQITMILADYVMGNRLRPPEWLGLACAFAGFVILVLPGVTAPPLPAFLLMTAAGCAWGGYTLMGRLSKNSLADTTGNFIRSLPLVALLLLVRVPDAAITPDGVLLALISGSLATGVVYVVWYLALSGLTTVQAAVVQLLVPVIAAFGGVVFLSEVITGRLLVASAMVLGGILLVLMTRKAKGIPAPAHHIPADDEPEPRQSPTK